MGVDVTVVVPVYNPGEFIEGCIESLLGQSLPPERYEVVFVDDGSTDGTPQRLDQVAATAPNVRVIHEPNSGWPGRPRNVGIDAAHGDYVYFCDHDDWMSREALERLVRMARRTGADIVLGKMLGHGRGAPRDVFRCDIERATFEETPLMSSLTPHKLFRRAFLDEHGIRFPEGKRRLEDHAFVVAAYLRAGTISVLGSYTCYHHMRRPDAGNAARQLVDPAVYYKYVEEVIDLIDDELPPGPLRDLYLARPFRHEMLFKLTGRGFRQSPPERQEAFVREIRRLMATRFPPDFADQFGIVTRALAAAARSGELAEVLRFAESQRKLQLVASLQELRLDERQWVLEVDAELRGSDGALLFGPGADGRWQVDPRLVPSDLVADELPEAELLEAEGDLVVVHRSNDEEWFVPTTVGSALVRAEVGRPDARRLVWRLQASIDPTVTAGGNPLTSGRWDLVARVAALGIRVEARVSGTGADLRGFGAVTVRRRKQVAPYLTAANDYVAFQVSQPPARVNS